MIIIKLAQFLKFVLYHKKLIKHDIINVKAFFHVINYFQKLVLLNIYIKSINILKHTFWVFFRNLDMDNIIWDLSCNEFYF